MKQLEIATILNFVEMQKEKISKLTLEINKCATQPNPEKVAIIRNNIDQIISMVASFSDSNNSTLSRLRNSAFNIKTSIRNLTRNETIDTSQWQPNITHRLDDFCTIASAWSPINPNVLDRGSQIIININLPKNVNIASIIGKQSM